MVSIVTMAVYHFRDKPRYWPKIAAVPCPLYSTPPLGDPYRSIAILFRMEKLEWCGHPMVKLV